MAFDEPQPGFLTRYRYWLLAIGAVLLVGGYVYRSSRPEPVLTTQVVSGPAERVLAVSGRTRPQVTVSIAPKSAGQIVKLTKEEGDAVRAGEVLVQLEADAPRAALDEAAAKIVLQQRAVAETERSYRRIEQLRSQGLATVKEFDTAKFELDQARLTLASLEAIRREASARLRDNTLTAPVSGVVLARPVDTGQVVSAQTVIYEIAPLADVEVEADVDEQYLTEVRSGQTADVVIAGVAKPIPATLYYVSPKVDQRTGGAKIRLRLAEQPAGLRAGLTADVNLIVERRETALTLPRSAILGRGTDAKVLLVDEGRVAERPVQFLDWPSERVIVLQGLKGDEQLLASPRADLIGERVVAANDPADIPSIERPRGSDARRAL
jgi:RND family efflux transporter MFP subunit